MQPSSAPNNDPSGNATALYFERDAFVGQRLMYCCGYSKSDGKRVSAYWPNTAYFCPVCGEVWAREILNHEFAYQPIPQNPWVVESRRCVEHGDGYLLIGKETQLQYCSLELLKREALILCLNTAR